MPGFLAGTEQEEQAQSEDGQSATASEQHTGGPRGRADQHQAGERSDEPLQTDDVAQCVRGGRTRWILRKHAPLPHDLERTLECLWYGRGRQHQLTGREQSGLERVGDRVENVRQLVVEPRRDERGCQQPAAEQEVRQAGRPSASVAPPEDYEAALLTIARKGAST